MILKAGVWKAECRRLWFSPAFWVHWTNKSDTSVLGTGLLGCIYLLIIVKQNSPKWGQSFFCWLLSMVTSKTMQDLQGPAYLQENNFVQ